MTLPNSTLVASQSIGRAAFESLYAGPAPWDIGKPQRRFVAVADRITSPVLDAGCGTGEHAMFLASRGHRVVGIDFVEEAIRRARAKAAERGLATEFLVNHGHDEHYGARPLKRAIQRYIEDPLSEKLLTAEFSRGDEIEVDPSSTEKDKLEFRVMSPSPSPQA